MVDKPLTLTDEQIRILEVTAMMVAGDAHAGFPVKLLSQIIPCLSTSGLGPAGFGENGNEDWPPPPLESHAFAEQVDHARRIFQRCSKSVNLCRNDYAWGIAQSIGHATGNPVCTGALILGALIEGFTVSYGKHAVGTSHFNVKIGSLRSALGSVR